MPTADVYVCLRDAAGKLVLTDTLDSGQQAPHVPLQALPVTVGNSGVALSVNGRRVKVKPSADPVNYP